MSVALGRFSKRCFLISVDLTFALAHTKARLLTDKKTGKSKGMAFLDVLDTAPGSYEKLLDFHHSLFRGKRRINVEPTAGGGGKSLSRMAKIDSKKMEFARKRDQVIDEMLESYKSEGKLSDEDMDEETRGFLVTVPSTVAKEALKEYVVEVNRDRKKPIDNRRKYFMGLLKRIHKGEKFEPKKKRS